MKRVLSAFVFSVFSFLFLHQAAAAVLPEPINLHDFSSLGVHTLCAARTDVPPVLDGKAESGEYPLEAAHLSPGNGAFFTDANGERLLSSPEASGVSANVWLCYDQTYFYTALEFSFPASSREQYLAERSAGWDLFLLLALDGESGLAGTQSRLLNRYLFSPGSELPTSFSGERAAVAENELPLYAPRLSSSWAAYRDNGVTAADGECWTADFYRTQCRAVESQNGNENAVTFEMRVPIEDVLLSLKPEKRQGALSAIRSGEDFFGVFSFRFAVSGPVGNRVYFSNARPAEDVMIPGADAAFPLPQAYLADHPSEEPNVNRIAFLPSPLHASVSGKRLAASGALLSETPPQLENSPPEGSLLTPTVPLPPISDPPEILPVTGDETPDEDPQGAVIPGSGWLPDQEIAPSETERILEEEEENGITPGNLLALIVVILLLICIICFYFLLDKRTKNAVREREEELEAAKKKKESAPSAKIRPRPTRRK